MQIRNPPRANFVKFLCQNRFQKFCNLLALPTQNFWPNFYIWKQKFTQNIKFRLWKTLTKKVQKLFKKVRKNY